MKLPNVEQAEVAEAKITRYLLDATHPVGRTKAVFFFAFGFTLENWTVLRDALLAHAMTFEVAEVVPLTEGTHYVMDGALSCPDGRTPIVRVVWRIDHSMTTPRLITT